MASWKIIPDPAEDKNIEYTSFLESRKFFAVDDSGSTCGSVAKQQHIFVGAIHNTYKNPVDAISLWGSSCDVPTQDFNSIRWASDHGGTQPSAILKRPAALSTVQASDMWFLLTDGEILDRDVHQLADLAEQHNILNVPLAFVITGNRGKTPSATNISVGISFFASAQDTLILFKEKYTGRIYVIAAKGCFNSLGGSAAAQDLESWDAMPVFENEAAFFTHCKRLNIQITKAESRTGLGKGVSLGAEWEQEHGAVQVDLDLLPQAGLLSDKDLLSLLADEAFDTLAVAYKTRSRIAELRAFVQRQKVEQVVPKLEDLAGAAAILVKMADSTLSEEQRKALQGQLREAHEKNRKLYQDMITNFEGSPQEQGIKKRNQLIDAALRSLASIEAASFNAEILSRKSNRARRAEVVVSTSAIDIAKIDLEAPSCKGFCLVCCGEEEVMSICFKQAQADNVEDNTTDFALNFPLAAGAAIKNVNLISSQNICFQCASLGPQGMSIYNEPLTAIIPAVQYDGGNKKYINDQLYLALTARLATGAAGVGQLFMAILGEVLRTKPWAGAGLEDVEVSSDEQHEALQRRKTFQWVLDQVVQNTRTREDFKETGDWVKFPQALAWVAKDFENNGLASFAVTYPVAGFDNLVALGRSTGMFSADMLRKLKAAKTVYSIAAKYLAELQSAQNGRRIDGSGFVEEWKQKYLETIYQDFNGPLIPRDRGAASLVVDDEVFNSRLAACIGGTQVTGNGSSHVRKVQLILFWLLFKLRGHCTAQTFFARINETEHLARAVLDPTLTVPEREHRATLLSIFAQEEGEMINASAAMQHRSLVPFANPFGPSVLCCGVDGCNESFCSLTNPEDVTARNINAIRLARTKHLIQVFGIRGRFEASTTGLPERPLEGHPPTSIHVNLHISIAREWAAHTEEKRRAIVADKTDREEFIASVRRRLCSEGRGNLFQDDLDRYTRGILPSFFEVLGKAVRMKGKSDDDLSLYQHDFDENKMDLKVKWELEASRR
ncbi:hypothetical protein BKA66DRAFT_565824 [Pyrenochaeta sp. MPI-SDFR-AT-0127]|nr:hypothetical protein BKA66DRAFT_565824 [Pyrenochaeta sp. MPI-SDFR-AT-0127]